MPEFSIESAGLLPRTAIYYNGQQLRGVKEVFLNLDENGTFDAIIQYEGRDEQIYTKNVMTDYLEQVQLSEPLFTEEEARTMTLLTVVPSRIGVRQSCHRVAGHLGRRAGPSS